MLDYFEIGQRIRGFRKERGLSQDQLSEKIGISITHMSHIETGNTKLSLPVLADLSEALGVTADALLFGDKEPKRIGAMAEIRQALDACDEAQAQLLTEIVRSTAAIFQKYGVTTKK